MGFLALIFLRGRRRQRRDQVKALSPVIDKKELDGRGPTMKTELDGRGPMMKTELDGRGRLTELPSQGLEHEMAG